jgi:hypothetical protein
MPESEKPIWIDILSLLIIGFGIGWLAGISISPVASIIISALLGIAISIVGITSLYLKFPKDGGDSRKIIGIESAEEIKIRKFALLVVGIVAGVNIGILMRVHETLGVEKRDESFVNMQKDLNELRSWFSETEKADNNAKISLSEEQIAQRILDKYYPKGGVAIVNKPDLMLPNANSHSAYLFDSKKTIDTSVDTCSGLTDSSGELLRLLLKSKGIFFEEMASCIQDDEKLKEMIDSMCCKNNQE